jgi:hypothetical protein
LLLDEQVGPCGQIYRNISAVPQAVADLQGKDYRHDEGLAEHLEQSSEEIKYGSLVWDVARDLMLTVPQYKP